MEFYCFICSHCPLADEAKFVMSWIFEMGCGFVIILSSFTEWKSIGCVDPC